VTQIMFIPYTLYRGVFSSLAPYRAISAKQTAESRIELRLKCVQNDTTELITMQFNCQLPV